MELFQQVPYRLMSAESVVNKETGASVNMDSNTVLLYCFMDARYKHFKRLGNEFFDNQDYFALRLGVSSRTVVTLIKKLVDVGLVKKSVLRTRGSQHSNKYEVEDIYSGKFSIVQPEGFKEAWCSVADIPQKPNPNSYVAQVKPRYAKEVNPFDFEDDPF